jgi:hypothetical protein
MSLPATGVRLFAAMITALWLAIPVTLATFQTNFEGSHPIEKVGPLSAGGWSWYAGDGEAEVDFQKHDGYARMVVDARRDRYNIWWAVVRTRVDKSLQLSANPVTDHELLIEARVRVSHAPRRINLHLSTTGTSHYDHLREYDIPVAGVWHEVSMTTDEFPLQPGEPIFAQVAMMDWGRELHHTDIEYLRVKVVEVKNPPPDLGNPQRYHPPIPAIETLPELAVATEDALIDQYHPDLVITPWGNAAELNPSSRLLAVAPGQSALLKWDLSPWQSEAPVGVGTLELTTQSVTRRLVDDPELGRIRVVEILPNAPAWFQSAVTYNTLVGSEGDLANVLNTQPIIDVLIDPTPGARNRITIPQAVMQRLWEGRTTGLALHALGPIHANFYARENSPKEQAPALRFRTTTTATSLQRTSDEEAQGHATR